MRKSFYTLSGIVNESMNQDVRNGGVFIFINRRQNIMKILHMEYAGMVIYHKKLESGIHPYLPISVHCKFPLTIVYNVSQY